MLFQHSLINGNVGILEEIVKQLPGTVTSMGFPLGCMRFGTFRRYIRNNMPLTELSMYNEATLPA